jgi:hypothetical protein
MESDTLVDPRRKRTMAQTKTEIQIRGAALRTMIRKMKRMKKKKKLKEPRVPKMIPI